MMKKYLEGGLIIAAWLVALYGLSTVGAHAADLYVATNGSDTNSGTQTAPFRTLQKGASVATPGAIIHVAPGTYSDTTYCSIPGVVNGTAAVCMQTSGTAAAPIAFVSDTPAAAKLVCPTDSAFFILAASHIVIAYFDMTCPGTANAYGFAAGTYGNNGYNIFYSNYLHDFATTSCPSTGVLFGSALGHDYFYGNVVRHGGSTTTAQPHCNQFHGIYTGSAYDVVANNMVSGIIGYGIVGYGSAVHNQTIANNLVFDNSQGGIIAENIGGATDYETITNNIAVNNGYGNGYSGPDGGIHLYGVSVGTNNLISNNLAYGNNNFQTLATPPATVVNTKTGTNASVFANYQPDKNWAPAAYNFSNYLEKAGSPSIDAGIATGAPPTDILNVSRPVGSGFDIGAFER